MGSCSHGPRRQRNGRRRNSRALTFRATSSDPSEMDPEPNLALTFREITELYQFGHAIYPKPCKALTKAEERTLLRLYTRTLLCPAVLKHFDPAYTGQRPHCAEKSSDISSTWCGNANQVRTSPQNPTPPGRTGRQPCSAAPTW